MTIQNTHAVQGGPPVSPVGAHAPKVVANAPKVEPTRGVALDTQQPTAEQMKNAIDVVNLVMQQSNHSLEFSTDSDTKRPVVKLVDTETGELIRQYPSEEMLAISRSIDEYQQRQGLLLKHKA